MYIFDPSLHCPSPSVVPAAAHSIGKQGPFATRFLLEALADLRATLGRLGSTLLLRHGDPADAIAGVVLDIRSALGGNPATADITVMFHDEPGTDEVMVADAVVARARAEGCSVRRCWGCTLKHPDDLPRTEQRWGALARPNNVGGKRRRGKGKGRPTTAATSPIGIADRGEPADPAADVRVPTTASADTGPSGDSPSGRVDVTPHRFHGLPLIMGEFRRAARAAALRPVLPAPGRLPPPPPGFVDRYHHERLPTVEELCCPGGTAPSLFGLPADVIAGMVAAAATDAPSDPRSAHPLVGGESPGLARLAWVVKAAATMERGGGGIAGGGVDGSAKTSAYLALGCLSPRQVSAACAGQDGADWLASHLEMRDFFMFSALAAGASLFRRDRQQAFANNLPVSHWRPLSEQPVLELWTAWVSGRTGLPLVDAAIRELGATGYMSNRCRQNCASLLSKDLRLDWRLGAE